MTLPLLVLLAMRKGLSTLLTLRRQLEIGALYAVAGEARREY